MIAVPLTVGVGRGIWVRWVGVGGMRWGPGWSGEGGRSDYESWTVSCGEVVWEGCGGVSRLVDIWPAADVRDADWEWRR
jgi:hypothetical protein